MEPLEDRVLLSAGDSIAHAVGLMLLDVSSTSQAAHFSAEVSRGGDVHLSKVTLDAGDVVVAAVDTHRYGGGLNSYLRILQETGPASFRQLAANDDARGKDAGLAFQAPGAGVYYLGVSGFDNAAYDPFAAGSGAGSSHGRFDLDVRRTAAPLAAAPVVASFAIEPRLAEWGDSIDVRFTIENRGGLDAPAATASLLISANNRFDDGVPELASAAIPALAAGASFTSSLHIQLGGVRTSLPSFHDSQRVFLGLQFGAEPLFPPLLRGAGGYASEGNDWASLQMLQSASAAGAANATLADAQSIGLDARTDQGMLPAQAVRFYQITLAEPGTLHAVLDDANGPISLTLLSADGRPIVRSDGGSITQGLFGGPDGGGTSYYLKAANLGPAARSYRLTTRFTPSVSHLQTIPLAASDELIVQGDFNGDGRPDLATSNWQNADHSPANNVLVLLGNGDGTFASAGPPSDLGTAPEALAAGDFNGDGRWDIAASSSATSQVMVLLGNGDGTFQDALFIDGAGGNSLAAADFDGDGRLDLAAADSTSDHVTLLWGDGLGGFHSDPPLDVPGVPSALAAGDLNGDGRLDLAVANRGTNEVTVFLNQAGSLQAAGTFAAGAAPAALAAADFDADGKLDLAVADADADAVTILRGDGHGSFQRSNLRAVGSVPSALVTGDFNADGRVDLGVANALSNNLTVLLGGGDATFTSAATPGVGANPFGLVAADFNGDGRVDVASADYYSKSVTVLLGAGDGTFPTSGAANTTGQHPDAVVSADLNRDGRMDLAVANSEPGTVTVLLGQGDGSFDEIGTFAAGTNPTALLAGDFNGDGRPDLAVADGGSNYGAHRGPAGVTLLLGHGDGDFLDAGFFPLDGKPTALAADDFDQDNRLDLAVAVMFNTDLTRGVIHMLWGDGRGGFDGMADFDAAGQPQALVAADFDGDGLPDLASASMYAKDVKVLHNDGARGFAEALVQPVDNAPIGLAVADVNGDGQLDLAVATAYASTLAVLLGDGALTFRAGGVMDLGTTITAITAGDFNGDGRPDLSATSRYNSADYSDANNVKVLLGDGRGDFVEAGTFAAGNQPRALAVADFNGDGRLDLAIVDFGPSSLTVLIGTGAGELVAPVLAPSPVRSTPLIVHWSSAATSDAVVLTQTGRILLRRGLIDPPGAFGPAEVLNPDPGLAARDLALVANSDGASLLAALGAIPTGDPNDPFADHVARVALYQPEQGGFRVLPGFALPAGFLAANIASADLNGDGLGDLVVSAAAADQVFVSLQQSAGVFGTPKPYTVGVNPSALELIDMNGDGAVDLAASSRFSGQVSVLLNHGDGVFASAQPYRAGAGLYALTELLGGAAAQSLEGTSGIVTGRFDDQPGTDVIAINGAAQTVTLLSGDEFGGLRGPVLTSFLGDAPIAIVAGHFITGDDNLDLAVLCRNASAVAIYRGDGAGNFTRIDTVAAGDEATGLASADVSRPGGGGPDGIADLVVGNVYGDLLILTGNGNGTFSQYRRADQTVSLAVGRTADTGPVTFYFSDRGNDRLAYRSAPAGAALVEAATVFQDRALGIQAPGPEEIVNVAGVQYLVVANSGGNEVLIYALDKDGRPDLGSQQTYFTGTDPVSLTLTDAATDLNQDAIPDLVVANQGSNDVSVFLGRLDAGTWTLDYRPRQESGGIGPSAVAIADVTGPDGTGAPDGVPDLLVSNAFSGDVSILFNRGDAFFINQPPDNTPALFTGLAARELFVGDFDGAPGLDLITVNTGSDSVTLVTNFLDAPAATTVSSGGSMPAAAVLMEVNGVHELLVANAGNGVLEVLQIHAGGFEVIGSLFSAAAPHLCDLALVTVGNALQLYGADAGHDVGVLLATFLPSAPNFIPPSPGFPAGQEINPDGVTTLPLVEVLLPLQAPPTADSPLPLVVNGVADGNFDANAPAPHLGGSDTDAGSRNLQDSYFTDNPSGILLNNVTNPSAPPTAPFVRPKPTENDEAAKTPLELYWQSKAGEWWPLECDVAGSSKGPGTAREMATDDAGGRGSRRAETREEHNVLATNGSVGASPSQSAPLDRPAFLVLLGAMAPMLLRPFAPLLPGWLAAPLLAAHAGQRRRRLRAGGEEIVSE